MRFLHTSDWHLGRQLHGQSLLEDQRHVLGRILEIAKTRAVEAIVVAGDVHDRAIPPAEAVELLDEFLTRARGELAVPVIMIAGNHDSARRLGFGSDLLREAGVVIGHDLRRSGEPFVLADEHGPVAFHTLPYAEPAAVRDALDVDAQGHEAALRILLERCRTGASCARRVLVSHCFVAGAETSESERPLSVGGADQVPASLFADFDYVALGHLHAPQCRERPEIRYSGSILKYSFSEVHHEKSVSIVELDAHGACTIETVALEPLRDTRIIEGPLAALLEQGAALARADDPTRNDYLLVRLQDTHSILDVMGKLRAVYPNVLHLERPALEGAPSGAPDVRAIRRGHLSMVDDFWRSIRHDPLEPAARESVRSTLERLLRREEA